jgi:hypothetical protein
MCLSRLLPRPDTVPKVAYKVLVRSEYLEGVLYGPYIGNERLRIGIEYKAINTTLFTDEGDSWYRSGYHVFMTAEDAREYMDIVVGHGHAAKDYTGVYEVEVGDMIAYGEQVICATGKIEDRKHVKCGVLDNMKIVREVK